MEAEGSSTLGKRKRESHSSHHRQNLLGQILRLGDRKPVRQQLKLGRSELNTTVITDHPSHAGRKAVEASGTRD